MAPPPISDPMFPAIISLILIVGIEISAISIQKFQKLKPAIPWGLKVDEGKSIMDSRNSS